ncbi:3-dehydroquinate dehydratase [Pelagivirga sediminicola]|uniref:3-dehydroquinate dehydratase n=1 Tax=Pelagivirga sediminicola TaxID=2170575 RepID=A0A2T7GBA1_9RHOB|nr:DUF2478 domain-containing protein [Pelagivirga sediminicola]PVA11691.1 3-dehydroquinate dehydratase [Pelagivirga sediminicola]
MKIAFVTTPEKGGIDILLSGIASRLQAEGVPLAGIVKDLDHDSRFANGCDMKVRVLPAGPVIKITQDLGAGSDACRLDPGAIAEAVMRVEAGNLEGAKMFILNKFGPEEAAGRGFCAAIGTALEAGIPVLVGVSRANMDAFDAFSGGLATALAPQPETVLNWARAAVTSDAPA